LRREIKFLNECGLSIDCSEEDGLFTERKGNGRNSLFIRQGLDGYFEGAHQLGMEHRTN
jgi:hypothetical protein